MKKRKLKENYDYNGSIKKKPDYIAENVYNLHGEIENS